jgi:hypothetical protein
MNTYTTRTYHELIPNELHGSHPHTELKLSYKGFPVERVPPYHLYEITPREGCDLPVMLSGKYTKLETLKGQIDRYLGFSATVSARALKVAKRISFRGFFHQPGIRPQRIGTSER